MKKAKLLLSLMIVTVSVAGSAEPLTCKHVFRPESREWTAIHSIQLMDKIANDSKIRASSDVGVMTKVLYGKMARNLRPEVLRENPDLETVVTAFERGLRREGGMRQMLQLKLGLPKGEPAVSWATRQVMEKGLTNFIATLADGPIHRRKLSDRLKIAIGRVLQTSVIQRTSLVLRERTPLVAPLRDVELPPLLMTKIIADGVEAHKAEIEAVHAASGQKKVDFYRSAQRAIGVATVVIAAWILFEKFNDFDIVTNPEPIAQGSTVTEQTVETQAGQSIEDLAKQLSPANN